MNRNRSNNNRQDENPRVRDELDIPHYVNTLLLQDLEDSNHFRSLLGKIKIEGGSTMEALKGKFNFYVNKLCFYLYHSLKAIISRISKCERKHESE